MNNQSRHNEILNMLRSSGPMSAQDLSKNLFISLSTIYRELREQKAATLEKWNNLFADING